ncbi:MAG: amidohydrolase family protein [Deltaproteobacteria bacterium]|nr:amidohydrolase family protein [Deltaproteobacteria bacterium]
MVAETIVKNANIVIPGGIVKGGIAIDRGKISGIFSGTSLPEAKNTIDAGNRYIIPGVVDPHIHYGVYHSCQEEVDDLQCAAYGGTTTACSFVGLGATAERGTYQGAFEEWKDIWERNAVIDTIFHGGMCSEKNIEEVVENAERYGITSYKFLMTCKGEEAKIIGGDTCDDGFLYAGFKSIARLGDRGLAMCHAEDIDIIRRILPTVKATGRQDLAAWAEARPGWVETLDVIRAISIAQVTGCPLYLVHIHYPDSVQVIREAQLEGKKVFAETCPQYLVLDTSSDIPGPLGKINPPLRDKASNEALWQAINEGVIRHVGSDHCSTTKDMASDLWTAPPGSPGAETLLPIMLSEGVNKGKITLQKLVEVLCTNNAKLFGIYPRKGTIQIGADADLVILDLDKKVKLSASTQHYKVSDYTPYEGLEVTGWPTLTMLRGNVVVRDGRMVAAPGLGRYIPRS